MIEHIYNNFRLFNKSINHNIQRSNYQLQENKDKIKFKIEIFIKNFIFREIA